MNERTITVNATFKVSEYTLSMIDAFTKEWGLRSRSETIATAKMDKGTQHP